MPGPDPTAASPDADGLGTLSLMTAADVLQHRSIGHTVDLAAERVRAQLVALAHQISKPRNYVGFSAFLLMALLKQRRPRFWIGENCDDIVDIYIPNFAAKCTHACAVEGICVALVENDRRELAYAEISPGNPLDRCRHFMAAVEVLEDDSAQAATPSEQLIRYDSAQAAARNKSVLIH